MLILRQGRSLVVHAPAKLNLFLQVLKKRSDGFHDIESVMTTVGLYDTLSFSETRNQQIYLEVVDLRAAVEVGHNDQSDDEIPTGPSNLVVQAAELLRSYLGVRSGVNILLHKRIPSAAGLAGGSSDAAATLLALNQFWKLEIPLDELHSLAGQLGSDVGFFLNQHGAAVCRGRGEQVDALKLPRSLHFVIAKPCTGLSTSIVYKHCKVTESTQTSVPLIRALQSGNLSAAGRHFYNSLQHPAEQLNEDVLNLKNIFESQSCYGHLMSGSGTSYFGLCANRQHARSIAARVRQLSCARIYTVQARC